MATGRQSKHKHAPGPPEQDPHERGSTRQKHPCPDCLACQLCSETRCRACRGCGPESSPSRRSIREQIELYNKRNEGLF